MTKRPENGFKTAMAEEYASSGIVNGPGNYISIRGSSHGKNGREKELKLSELKKSVIEMKGQDFRCIEMQRILRKADQQMKMRRMYLEFEQEELYSKLQKDEELQGRKIAKLEQEQKLAQAMAELKRKNIVEIKTNELFRKVSPEHRRYEKQIQTAYLKKELMCQIKEKEALKKEQKVRDYYDDLKRIEISDYGIKYEIEEQAQKKDIKFQYKKAIIEQMQENTEKQQLLRSQNRLTNIELPNNWNSQNKGLKSNFSKREMEEFLQIKNDLKKKERQEADKMDKCIEEYLINVKNRTKQHEDILNKNKEQKDIVQKHLFDQLISLKSDASRNREMLRILLLEEQHNSLKLVEEREKNLRKQRQDEMVKQNEEQLKIKKDKEKTEKEKDSSEAKKQLQTFIDYNMAEDEKNCKRQQIKIEYGKELMHSIALKNDLKIKQRAIMKNESSNTAEVEKKGKLVKGLTRCSAFSEALYYPNKVLKTMVAFSLLPQCLSYGFKKINFQ